MVVVDNNELRRTCRHPLRIRAEVTRLDTYEAQTLQTLNISLGGVCLEDSARAFPLGTGVRIVLSSWPQSIEPLVGNVVHAFEMEGRRKIIGVRFNSVSAAQNKTIITRYHGDHNAEQLGGPRTLASFLQGGYERPAQFCAEFPHAFLVSKPKGRLHLAGEANEQAYLVRCLAEESVWHSVSVGRDESCDIRIRDKRVSRHHALFERNPDTGEYLLLDKGSNNGTHLDGRKLEHMQPQRICSGSVVDFGGFGFRFLSAQDMFLAMTHQYEEKGAL